MFRILLIVLLVACGAETIAQVLQPAKITASPLKNEVRTGDLVELIFKATIDKNWYIYSLGFDPECGPIPISITFQKNPGFELVGELKAINHKKKHDKIFDCDVNIFEGTGEFRQTIRILTADAKLEGAYEGQVCSETEGKCVLFDGDFTITGLKISGSSKDPQSQATNETTKNDTLSATPVTGLPTEAAAKEGNLAATFSGPVLDKSILEGTPDFEEATLWGTIALAFILGIWGLLTPCVFPMIPMTVSFFLRDNQPRKEGIRNALLFGLSIISLFTIVGATFAVTLGPEGLNALATHWAPNLFVFLIFIVFALSFFGLFEINAPYQLVNAADRRAEKGGFVGIFFMAVTLVLVSFSCTIPIVGTALFLFNSGQVLTPILTMFSYSLAFALPFTLFALFPEWIKSLPKSGGWLNAVKVTFGFLELALALKFFSIADQAYHWGLLDRDLNIAIWVVIFTLMGFYFLGKLPMKGDSPIEKLSVPRLLLATLTFSFVVYITPGLWGAPLKALAGYLPPMYTHDFNLLASSKETTNATCEEPKYVEFLHLPHGLSGYFDYKQALECARKLDKPLFIDFTGHGCTNCREMEAAVWSEPQVLERLKRDYVVVALYVDDKTELPESEWFTSKYDNKVKKTIGKQNADLQIANLENNAQPFYILLGKDERVLAWPYGYDRNVGKFVQFLDEGRRKYKEVYQ